MAAEQIGDGVRALFYALGQGWDASRGLFMAYQVETGKDAEVAIPPWDALSPENQRDFARHTQQAFALINAVVLRMATTGDLR